MKKILALIVGLAASGLALPSTAQAGSLRIGFSTNSINGYHACGCAIQTRRVFAGYDHYRRPIYRYHSVPTVHRCGHRHGVIHQRNHQQRNHYVRNRRHQQRDRYYNQRRYQQRSPYRRGYRAPICR